MIACIGYFLFVRNKDHVELGPQTQVHNYTFSSSVYYAITLIRNVHQTPIRAPRPYCSISLFQYFLEIRNFSKFGLMKANCFHLGLQDIFRRTSLNAICKFYLWQLNTAKY